MTDERSFIGAILANPGDDVPRLIYADWLEERGDPRAEDLRLEMHHRALCSRPATRYEEKTRIALASRRLEELRSELDEDWLVEMDHATIENCNDNRCRQRWELLSLTDTCRVRQCGECGKRVFHVASMEEYWQRRHAGVLVARYSHVSLRSIDSALRILVPPGHSMAMPQSLALSGPRRVGFWRRLHAYVRRRALG